MHCGGCSGAVTRALQKAKDNGGARSHYVPFPPSSYFITGVSSFDVSLEKQEVIVESPLAYDEILEKIKKTGKDVCFISATFIRTQNFSLIIGSLGHYGRVKVPFDVASQACCPLVSTKS